MQSKTPITQLTLADSEYPALLKQISDAPKQLYVRGILPPENRPLLAVVGTRKLTAYGKQVTYEIVRAVAAAGVGIVSGLAYGVDAVAHEAALVAGGYTIGVLGGGIDDATIYPAGHRQLATRILKSGGAIISEYPAGFKPTNYSFPQRNRIIAGLCKATLVTEAPIKSGALITAKAALEYSRDVLAIPSPITSETGTGTNLLIKNGALVVTEAADILMLYGIEAKKTVDQPTEKLTETEMQILQCISPSPEPADAIIKRSKQSSGVVLAALMTLILKRYVQEFPGRGYAKTSVL